MQFKCQKQFYCKLFSLANKLKCNISLTIQLNISHLHSVKCQTVLFQTVHFGISTHFSSILLIDRTLSGFNTPGQSGTGSDSNKGVLCITGASRLDCFVLYRRQSLGKSYPSAKMQSVYSDAPADWTGAKGIQEHIQDLDGKNNPLGLTNEICKNQDRSRQIKLFKDTNKSPNSGRDTRNTFNLKVENNEYRI